MKGDSARCFWKAQIIGGSGNVSGGMELHICVGLTELSLTW